MSKTGKSRFSRLLPKFLRGGDKKTDGGIDSKSPFCFIHFLDDSDHQMQIKGNWKGGALQEKVCELLGLQEKDYFGLRFIDSLGQTHWLDRTKSLSSQFKGCQTPHKLYFGVKFYAADPCKLREEITRYLFFLQVKQDILQGRLPVTFDEAAELCAYAVQSELGDFDPRQYTEGYVSEFCFVPNQTEDLERRVTALHRRMGGLVPLMAEYRYLDKVKWLDMYGVDLHPVLGEANVEYFLGLTPTGIVVYKNKNKVGNYFWPRISKVTFKGKIFIVKVKDKNNEEHAYAFELPRKTACKHLWKCCVEHHAFFRLNQTQERTSRENRVLRSVSSNRRSGRSERQAISDNLSKTSTSVNRLPSRRQPRRVSSESRINSEEKYKSQYDQDTGMVTMVMRPEPVRAPRHRSLPELQGHESPRSTKSAPWETNFDYGLYTHGKDSPVSERSNKAREQRHRAVTGSDSESGISQRRKYFPNRRGSDNDSDVSVSRRRRRDIDSDSASDVSSRYPASQGHNDRSKSAFPVLYPFHDKENRPNGSIPSLHSAPAGEAKQRRRRRYDLKEPNGLSTDELREIPFVKVETKASLFKLKYSPKLRQKVKAAKQKSLTDVDQNRNQIPRKQNSTTPLDDEVERDMSVRSQPLPTKSSRDRYNTGHNQNGVGHGSRAVSRHHPPSHHPQTQTTPHHTDSHPAPQIPNPRQYDSETDGRAKRRSEKPTPSNIPSELSYQPSQSPYLNGGAPPHEKQHEELRSRKQRDSYPASQSSRSSNHVPRRVSRDPSDKHVRLSDPRSGKSGPSAPGYSGLSNENAAPPLTLGSSSPQKHANSRSSDAEPSQPPRQGVMASSASSTRPPFHHHHHHHRDSVSHSHPRSQGAYDSDVSSSIQRRRERPREGSEREAARTNPSRYSGRYSREQEDYGYSDTGRGEMEYDCLHPHRTPDPCREGSRSSQRGEGRMSSGYQYREEPAQQDHIMGPPPPPPPATSQEAPTHPPTYEGRHHGNVSYSSLSSPPQNFHQYHHHHQQQQQQQQQNPQPPHSSASSSYPNQSYQYGQSCSAAPFANTHYDQGHHQRPRSYGQEEGSRSMPHRYDDYRSREEGDGSGLYGEGEGHRGRFPQQAPPYQSPPTNQPSPHPQPLNHSLQSRTQGTPPRSQGTPPRHQQGTPPRYQGTPPRYQGMPSKQSVSGTPPRQSVDPRYSQGGLLSVHAREQATKPALCPQSEGSSSQASVRGPGHFHRPSHPSQGPIGPGRSDHRSMGNSLTPEQARQLLKSSNYNPDLCTEL
ncbi:hypothetical protein ACOMHN_021466 [Nucella lapillus]